MATNTVGYASARRIHNSERDRHLSLLDRQWPRIIPKRWSAGEGLLRRIIKIDDAAGPFLLEESVLRFPSAPVYGFQRFHDHHVDLGASPNLHTYRVLRSGQDGVAAKPVERLFLMHTGLNERDTMGLYYQLAAKLVQAAPATACIVRPFPGHLTRFPFQAFAETPLDRYLWDGSHLFRQFLRYMIETQWFLSALVRRSSYRCASGVNLLAESSQPATSRLDPDYLATAMAEAWHRLYEASAGIKRKEVLNQHRGVSQPHAALPDDGHFKSAITSLRDLLNLDRDYPGQTGDTPGHLADPALHVLGYSLGGFTAQSVFMSWPFLITSCSTLLAGGPLRDLAPTAFAHPEEWKTVLHSLRYELDDLMMSEDIGFQNDSVAGVDPEIFTYFKRTFYEVFQQEYHGSFQSRLAAFRERMLFIVGGNDPIVQPKNVLASSPPGGINLLEIAGLGHFLAGKPSDREEFQQREFWIPELAALIGRCADNAARSQAAERPYIWFDADMRTPLVSKEEFDVEFGTAGSSKESGLTSATAPNPVRRLSAAELLTIESNGALPGELFERCLDDLLARVASNTFEDDGILIILRNELPTMLLHDSMVRERAAALYHDDFRIVRYCHGITVRRRMLDEHIGQICLVLPWNAESIMRRLDRAHGYPSQSESAGGQVRDRTVLSEAWESAVRTCTQLTQGPGKHSLRVFNGNDELLDDNRTTVPASLAKAAQRASGNEPLTQVASLPDCWIWVSRNFLVAEGIALSLEEGIMDFPRVVSQRCGGDQDDGILDDIRKDRVRMITVSRARYNPRYRGRLIVTAQMARSLLVHAALCIALSTPVTKKGVKASFN